MKNRGIRLWFLHYWPFSRERTVLVGRAAVFRLALVTRGLACRLEMVAQDSETGTILSYPAKPGRAFLSTTDFCPCLRLSESAGAEIYRFSSSSSYARLSFWLPHEKRKSGICDQGKSGTCNQGKMAHVIKEK